MLDVLVEAKTDLEAKINDYDKQIQKILKANTNLEARLESSNGMIICLEAKIEAHETKIADLEAQKENETAADKPEINENKNVIGKRTYGTDNNDSTNKKIKINDAPNLPSTEQTKDLQRALTILSLASNPKEFFIPAITSDSK